MSKEVCVIIPIYNKIPTDSEDMSIKRNLLKLTGKDIFFAAPRSMDCRAYEQYGELSENIRFVRFDDSYFKSNKTYSRLILSEEFYTPFIEYEYMLIAQTDTLILGRNKLEDFICRGYDYWGAPWPEGPFTKPYSLKDRIKLLFVTHPDKIQVGNGGFSLRKVKSTYELVKAKKLYIKVLWKFNEDMFFSLFAYKEYRGYTAAEACEAAEFALETNMREELVKGNIPYAVHAWEKHIGAEDIKKYFDAETAE